MLQITYPANQGNTPQQIPFIKVNQDGSLSYPFFHKLSLEKAGEKYFNDLNHFLIDLLKSEGKYWEDIYPAQTRDHKLFFPIQSKIREILVHISHDSDKVKKIYAIMTEGKNLSLDNNILPTAIIDVRFLDYKCRLIDYSTLIITFDNQQSIKLTLRLLDKTVSADHLILTWI